MRTHYQDFLCEKLPKPDALVKCKGLLAYILVTIISIAQKILTSIQYYSPVCPIRSHGFNSIFFRIAPIDPIIVQIINRKTCWPAKIFRDQSFSLLSIHPGTFNLWLPSPVSPIHEPERTEPGFNMAAKLITMENWSFRVSWTKLFSNLCFADATKKVTEYMKHICFKCRRLIWKEECLFCVLICRDNGFNGSFSFSVEEKLLWTLNIH